MSGRPPACRLPRTTDPGRQPARLPREGAPFASRRRAEDLVCREGVAREEPAHSARRVRGLIEKEDNLRLDIVGSHAVAPVELIVNKSDSQMVSELRMLYDIRAWGRVRTWLKREFPRRLRRLRDTSYWSTFRGMVPGRMAGHVWFVGVVANEELPEWYRGADLVVLPSLYEAFGIPPIEAMASETPILAPRTGGIPEIVEDGRTGLLVTPGRAHELAEGMPGLMWDGALRRRVRAERVESGFLRSSRWTRC